VDAKDFDSAIEVVSGYIPCMALYAHTCHERMYTSMILQNNLECFFTHTFC